MLDVMIHPHPAIDVTPIDPATDTTTPAWMARAIAEARGRLGTPRAWLWQVGDALGTALHFTLGRRAFFVAIQCNADDEEPGWAETCFAGSESGIIAALAKHFGAHV